MWIEWNIYVILRGLESTLTGSISHSGQGKGPDVHLWWATKHEVFCYHGILFNDEKQQGLAACYNMRKSTKYHAK